MKKRLSNQAAAKIAQNYTPKAIPKTCMNCKFFEFDKVEVKTRYQTYFDDKNLRCSKGGFAVKKMGACDVFEMKEQE
jgi:hypothetical protein